MNKIFIILCQLFILFIVGCSKKVEILPEKVNQLILVKTIAGEEAKNYINKLHFQPVTNNENLIGHYEDGSGSAIVYVTLYKNHSEAEKDFVRMTRKISPENSVFIYPQFFDYRGNKIYRCFGMGMTHYVFVCNGNLYWISVDTHLARNFFEKFYDLIN